MAEYLLKIQDPVAMAAHIGQFTGPKRLEEAMKIAGYKKAVFQD